MTQAAKVTRGPVIRAAIVWLASTIALVVVGLWPFDVQRPCRSCQNDVSFGPNGMSFGWGGMVIDPDAGMVLSQLLSEADGMTIAVQARSDARFQQGPARLVTLSRGADARNFTIGQQRGALDFRLRTPQTGPNGSDPSTSAPSAIEPGRMQFFVATYDGEAFRIFVDGTLAQERLHVAGPMSDWGSDFQLVFGNEVSGDRPWRGTLSDVAIFARALSPSEASLLTPEDLAKAAASQIYRLASRCPVSEARGVGDTIEIGTCRVSIVYQSSRDWPLLAVGKRDVVDYLGNLALWCLVTLFICWVCGRPSLRMIFFLTALALFIELAQMPIYSRTSSSHDLLSALIGIVCGWAVNLRLRSGRWEWLS